MTSGEVTKKKLSTEISIHTLIVNTICALNITFLLSSTSIFSQPLSSTPSAF